MSTVSVTAALATTSGSSASLSASQKIKIAQDMQALAAALKANNTKAAQKAMQQLQIDSAPPKSSGASSASSSTTSSSPLAKVASALNSGDISTAQTEFADFEAQAAAYSSSRYSQDGPASSDT